MLTGFCLGKRLVLRRYKTSTAKQKLHGSFFLIVQSSNALSLGVFVVTLRSDSFIGIVKELHWAASRKR